MFIRKWFILAAALLLAASPSAADVDGPASVRGQGADPLSSREVRVSLDSVLRAGVRRNASLMSDYLQSRIAEESVKGERSIYEPMLQSSLTSQTTRIQNSAEETLYRADDDYNEFSNLLDLGLSGVLPSGAQWSIKWTNTQRNSSIIDRFRDYRSEYSSSLKLSVGQPLLKGAGRRVTETKIALAAIQKDIDYGKFEQRLMELLGITIQVYWKLYGAQQVYGSWLNSIKIAEQSLGDIEQRVLAGKMPETELLEAQNGIHQRRTELYAARSKVVEAQSQLFSLLNFAEPRGPTFQLLAADDPRGRPSSFADVRHYVRSALEKWPEYQNVKRQVEKERTQVEYASNQALPQLDLVGTVGPSSLDRDYEGSYRYLADDKYLSWSVGLKFSMPFLEGGQARSALAMAKLRLRQAEEERDGLEKSLINSIYSKIDAARSLQEQLRELEKGLEIRARLLAIEQDRLKAGRVGQKALLAQEEEYVNFQRKLLNCLVSFKTAEAALEIASGDILGKYGIDAARYAARHPDTRSGEGALPWE
ncbi:MAG: TolC family protein [Pseudomonadota bacterium]